MKEMIGLFGTVNLPLAMVILAPPAGAVRTGSAVVTLGSALAKSACKGHVVEPAPPARTAPAGAASGQWPPEPG